MVTLPPISSYLLVTPAVTKPRQLAPTVDPDLAGGRRGMEGLPSSHTEDADGGVVDMWVAEELPRKRGDELL